MSSVTNGARGVEIFAHGCEQMNEFARELRQKENFAEVRTGADIRNYDSGWRLEKYVEAEIDAIQGFGVTWWLELGWKDDKWLIGASVSVSHTDLFYELPDCFAVNEEELKLCLEKTLKSLKSALKSDSEFCRQVARLRKTNV